MLQFIEQCFIWPILPASVLIVLIMLYGVLVILGAVDIQLFDFDLDTDIDVDAGAESIGFVALKFLNIGNVPVMIWVAVFGLLWWIASLLLWAIYDQASPPEGTWSIAALVLRNVVIGLAGAKFATEPMRKYFDHTDNYKPKDLVGRQCEVTTYKVTSESGQAKLKTDAAPLLIDVRTEGETLSKGDLATIVDVDTKANLYLITKT
ncbi:MAG: YqiJ family protein, partial [Pirellulales bacterium]|nr:YqiJ family protein [Pirellulales bacterium]